MIREEVLNLVKLGPLPPEKEATVEFLDEWVDRLNLIGEPVNKEEAALLIRLFGPDLCYGCGWSLLHLIETLPSSEFVSLILQEDLDKSNYWISSMINRARNGGLI
jgi:hypothetical protein